MKWASRKWNSGKNKCNGPQISLGSFSAFCLPCAINERSASAHRGIPVCRLAFVCQAQQSPPPIIHGLNTNSSWQSAGSTNYFRNGVLVSNETAVITSDSAVESDLTGDVVAEGDVTILDHGHIWRGTNFIYNFKTGDVRASTFKSLQEPFTLSGPAWPAAAIMSIRPPMRLSRRTMLPGRATASTPSASPSRWGSISRRIRPRSIGETRRCFIFLITDAPWDSIRTIGNTSRATAASSAPIC